MSEITRNDAIEAARKLWCRGTSHAHRRPYAVEQYDWIRAQWQCVVGYSTTNGPVPLGQCSTWAGALANAAERTEEKQLQEAVKAESVCTD